MAKGAMGKATGGGHAIQDRASEGIHAVTDRGGALAADVSGGTC